MLIPLPFRVIVCTILGVILCCPLLAAAEVRVAEGPVGIVLEVEAEPAVGQWSLTKAIRPDGSIQSTGGYVLSFVRTDQRGYPVWTAKMQRADGAEFRITQYAYECRIPLGKVAAVFDTQAHRDDTIFRQAPQIDVALDVRPNQGVPFMMACDHYGRNSMAVGPIDQAGTYRMTGRRIGEQYSIRFDRAEYAGDQWFTGKAFTDAVFVSAKSEFWFDAARAFADVVDAVAKYEPKPAPPKADLPFYSTWYAFGEHIDDAIIRAQGPLATKMGCGNFLIFIGWAQCENWFSSENEWGDYTACEPRFPQFAELVRYLQKECDLAVEVWVAPTWIGAKSKAFEAMQDHRSKWPDGGYDRNLDPRSPEVRKHIRAKFAELAKDYGLDGFYVDFADTLQNRNAATHVMEPRHFGSAYEMFLADVYAGFALVNEQPLAEYRVPFTNLLSKRYASVFNTTYTDGDWNRSRLLAITMRPFSRGVITRADPLVWTPAQLDHRDNMGKSLSAMMLLGPPGISMDLTKLNEEQRDRIGKWLKFYADHREDIVGGEFRSFGEEFHYPEMLVHRDHTAYAWVSRWQTGRIPLSEGTRHAFIFTALPEDVSFIARIDLTQVTGLVPGEYRARWVDSSMESHDGWFDLTYRPTPAPWTPGGKPAPLRSARENWDFVPDVAAGRPSLDIRRGGFLELELK